MINIFNQVLNPKTLLNFRITPSMGIGSEYLCKIETEGVIEEGYIDVSVDNEIIVVFRGVAIIYLEYTEATLELLTTGGDTVTFYNTLKKEEMYKMLGIIPYT